MKIKTTVIYIGLLLLLSSANTFAQDASISVGVKSWAANIKGRPGRPELGIIGISGRNK